jgi:chaperonin GroES
LIRQRLGVVKTLSMTWRSRMEITPQKTKIILEELEEKTDTHLEITTTSKKDRQVRKGKVVRVGADIDFCIIGDTVFYTKYSGFELEYEGKTYLVIEEDQLLGVEG